MEFPSSDYKDENIKFNEFLTRLKMALNYGEINLVGYEKKIEEIKRSGSEAGKHYSELGENKKYIKLKPESLWRIGQEKDVKFLEDCVKVVRYQYFTNKITVKEMHFYTEKFIDSINTHESSESEEN